MNKQQNNTQQSLDITQILKEAISMTNKNWFVLLPPIVICLAITVALNYAYSKDLVGQSIEELIQSMEQISLTTILLLNLVRIVITVPILTGVTMISVFELRSNKLKSFAAFNYLYYILPISLASVLLFIATQIGVQLLIIPGIYLFIVANFTQLLIVDKNLSPLMAIQISIKVSNKHFVSLFMLFILFIVGIFICILTSMIAAIYLAPLYYNAKAIVYTQLFDTLNEIDEQGTFKRDRFNA